MAESKTVIEAKGKSDVVFEVIKDQKFDDIYDDEPLWFERMEKVAGVSIVDTDSAVP